MSEPQYTTVDQQALHASFMSIADHFDDLDTKLHSITPTSITDVNAINEYINNYRAMKNAYVSLDDSLELVLIRVRRLEQIFSNLDAEYIDALPDDYPPVTNDPTPDPDETPPDNNDPTPDPTDPDDDNSEPGDNPSEPEPHPWDNLPGDWHDAGRL